MLLKEVLLTTALLTCVCASPLPPVVDETMHEKMVENIAHCAVDAYGCRPQSLASPGHNRRANGDFELSIRLSEECVSNLLYQRDTDDVIEDV